jgi:opacity protein-like surface antigen
MRKLIALAGMLLLLVAGIAAADTSVRGYTRSDGTYVAPHTRSSPNNSYNDNWSVKPNTNPNTGEKGTREPTLNDKPPSNNGYGGGYRQNNR